MNQETKLCQNCKQNFTIAPEDFRFYEKIQVPTPTWCPECRLIRRMVFRNFKTLYKRKVEGKEGEVFSMVAPDSTLRVVDEKLFWSNKIDATKYGKDYDFNKPFFQQFEELLLAVPFRHKWSLSCVNSEYCNNVIELKNSYLSFNSGFSENIFYAIDVINSKDCVDADKVQYCELSYEIFDSERCSKIFFSSECKYSYNIYFSHNLINCSDCFLCSNLRNKQYCILNEQYTKEEYFEKIKDFNIGSYRNILRYRGILKDLRLKLPLKFYHGRGNINSCGDYIEHCKNVHNSFYSKNLEDCSYCQYILFIQGKDSYDMTVAGGELCYELEETGGYDLKFCWYNSATKMDIKSGLKNMEYTVNSRDSSYLFGCVGLNNKQYCVLNRQYAKMNYEILVPKIKEHMNAMPYIDKKGRVYKYGEFFPPELSPFAYNETIAQEYFHLTKDEAIAQGYSWKDREKRDIKITMKTEELPDHIKDTPDSITSEVIQCAHAKFTTSEVVNFEDPPSGGCSEQCTEAFRIIPQELKFYRKMNLPLPRLCPNCRHYQRVKQRNPLRLWHRTCMCDGATLPSQHSALGGKSVKGLGYSFKNTAAHFHKEKPCPNEFETSYSPERKEIVYCEKCYSAEVA